MDEFLLLKLGVSTGRLTLQPVLQSCGYLWSITATLWCMRYQEIEPLRAKAQHEHPDHP